MDLTINKIRIKIKEYMIMEENNEHIIDLILATALSLEFDDPYGYSLSVNHQAEKLNFLKF